MRGSFSLFNVDPTHSFSYYWNGIPAYGNAVSTIGLIRDVKLVIAPAQSIVDTFVSTKSLNKDGSATLVIAGTVRNDQSATVRRTVAFEMLGKNFSGETDRLPKQELNLHSGENKFSFEITIKNPALWWTWDLGKQYLYKLVTTLEGSGDQANAQEITFGIRTIVRKEDMSYWLNGKHMQPKGVWYPMGNYYSSQNTAWSYRTDLLLLRAANANFILNHTVAEKTSFYDLADELGLMVFVQLPFNQFGPFEALDASSPRREPFLKMAFEQSGEIIREHRNHPSVVSWGPLAESQWTDQAKKGSYDTFYDGMKALVAQLDPGVIYQASYCDFGEEHIWRGTAADGEDNGTYQDHYDFQPAFVSEYGSSAMSSYENLHKWLTPDEIWSDKNPRTPQWFYLPIDVPANSYMSSDTVVGLHSLLAWPNKMVDSDPRSAKQLVESSQLYQDFIMRYASDAFRRKKYNPIQGIRWWAYKDLAPGYQWGFLDFDQVPKIAYYSFKRSMAPLAVSLAIKDELEPQEAGQVLHLPVWVVSDQRTEVPLDVQTQVLDLAGHSLVSQSVQAIIGADESRTVDVLNWTVPNVSTPTVFALRVTAKQHASSLSATSTIYLKAVPAAGVPAIKTVPQLSKKPRVLLIGTKAHGALIAKDLRALGAQVDEINEDHVVRFSELRQADELRRRYDVIWLANFDSVWKLLDDDMAEGIAQAVREGVGFVHTGGRSSFHGGGGLGACLDFTKLSEVLPVKVREGRDDLNVLNTSKDVRVLANGWTDAGLKQIGVQNFNEVQTRQGSEVIMKFDDWPLLAAGHYGKGNTVAFMGYTPTDDAAEATYAALYAQMILQAQGENPAYRYASVGGKDKPLMQMLKEQPQAEATVSPATIDATVKDSAGNFTVQIMNGDRFARLMRLRIEWSDPSGPAPVVLYGDNYFDLFPAQEKDVLVEFQVPGLFAGSAKGVLIVEGTNVPETRIPISIEAGR